MGDLKQLFKENYLRYASYVILDRAIPELVDGLKPVQRRILWTLFLMDDGKLHKVANVAGQTMALHPHGDAPITDALINLASKGFLLDKQGNFGNSATGDSAAAARYIETRLSKLAKETLFNPALTMFAPSYDGRVNEPVALPAKIPLLLMQGAEGIAVGMATKILPHNFKELLTAQIAHLQGKSFKLLPDFPFGGTMDASEYEGGKGKVKLRAKIEVVDDKTLIVREICHGTTTESLIASIDEAAKKGSVKIDAINDYTAEAVEIEIKLPRGQYAEQALQPLFAFTECEVTIHSQPLTIKERMPTELSVEEMLASQTELLKGYLQAELEIEAKELLNKIFDKSLERIFIENRLYKKIEEISSYEAIHDVIEKALRPFHKELLRIPTREDREKLLSLPIRRISLFDLKKNEEERLAFEKRLAEIEKSLKNITKHTILYIEALLKKYGALFPRRTQIAAIEQIDRKEAGRRKVRVGYDSETGFLGLKVASKMSIECTNLDKILILYADGSYFVLNLPQKQYVRKESEIVWIGVADKETVLSVIYTDEKRLPFAKRFVVDKFILNKVYRFLGEEQKLEFVTSDPHIRLALELKAKPKQKASAMRLTFDEIPVKGVAAKGIRLANKELKNVKIGEKK